MEIILFALVLGGLIIASAWGYNEFYLPWSIKQKEEQAKFNLIKEEQERKYLEQIKSDRISIRKQKAKSALLNAELRANQQKRAAGNSSLLGLNSGIKSNLETQKKRQNAAAQRQRINPFQTALREHLENQRLAQLNQIERQSLEIAQLTGKNYITRINDKGDIEQISLFDFLKEKGLK